MEHNIKGMSEATSRVTGGKMSIILYNDLNGKRRVGLDYGKDVPEMFKPQVMESIISVFADVVDSIYDQELGNGGSFGDLEVLCSIQEKDKHVSQKEKSRLAAKQYLTQTTLPLYEYTDGFFLCVLVDWKTKLVKMYRRSVDLHPDDGTNIVLTLP